MYEISGTAEGHTPHQHPSAESTAMMDGAVSGFSGAVTSSGFVGVQLNKVLQKHFRAQKARSLSSHRLIS